MKRRHIITSKIKRGSLIRYPLENIKRESFETIRKELKEILHKKPGIYALYRGSRLVYVGLASSIYGRVKGYLKSKRLKWDNFSIFIIKRLRYLRDLETAVVRIAKPEANRIEGRVPHHNFLKQILKDKVNKKRRSLRKKLKIKNTEIRSLEKEIKLMQEAIYSNP